MAIRRVAIIFDDQLRPDTTGVYCRRALAGLVEVSHFRPLQFEAEPRTGFDLYLAIDDDLDVKLPSGLGPTAWWAIDTHRDFERRLKQAEHFDAVFAAQRDGAERFEAVGVTATWLPLACDPQLHRKHEGPKSCDVCFVGHLFPGARTDLVRLLQERFPNTLVDQRYFDEMARAYSASRIVFNRSLAKDVNMRVFEALACGSLLVTNDLAENGQEELFRDGVHLATYRNAEELLDKVTFYLKRETLREKIAAAGRLEVTERHTYRHRMQQLLEHAEAVLSRRVVGFGQPGVAVGDSGVEEIVHLIPTSARRVLVVGSSALREAVQAEHAFDVTYVRQGEPMPENGDEDFDAVVGVGVLGSEQDPLNWMRGARNRLKSGGSLIVDAPNVRHHRIIEALLEGSWIGVDGRERLRAFPVFTRRELEKLLYRAALSVTELRAVRETGDVQWDTGQGSVRIGTLHLSGLPAAEVDEFSVDRFVVRATPESRPDPGLTSIVIIAHNELAATRRCLESLQRFTDEPLEIVCIDNASKDGTTDYVRSLKNVQLIVNRENRGFPHAANQGIHACRGEQILLLNNDTVVTTGWLHRMLSALSRDPMIGLVGPCSNCVSGSQQIEVRYGGDLGNLDGFAWDWGQSHNGQIEDTDRLVGFCLLVRRRLVDQIGPLDERFGIGCFEDDDYTRRALRAGWRAVIARDAFVHHEGGRTFRSTGVDFAALMRTNEAIYCEKWQEEERCSANLTHAAGGMALRDATKTAALKVRDSLKIGRRGGLLLPETPLKSSLCMIVRDSSRTLPACLESIRPWVDEMVVVDTGSKDDTPEIARRLGARVFHFPWCDDFSAARNESVRHARGEWIFWMDSDDTIDDLSGRKLRQTVEQHNNPAILGYVMQVHCPGAGDEGAEDVTVVDHVKLFQNRAELYFEGRIHEQVLPSIRRAGGDVAWTDVFVVHSGYDHSPEGQKRKRERDFRLLELELRDRPNHPFALFNLGMTYADVGEYEKGLEALQRSIALSDPMDSQVRKAYALMLSCLWELGRHREAEETCEQARRLFPDDRELLFREGLLHHRHGRFELAVGAFERVLANDEPRHFSSIDRGIHGYKTRQNLAVVYGAMGKFSEAEAMWRAVTEERPRLAAAWEGLGEVLLSQGRIEDAKTVAGRLSAEPGLRCVGLVLQAAVAAEEGRTSIAKERLDQATQEFPDAIEPLLVRCRFLFEHGTPAEAEEALKSLIARVPDDAAAYHNLGTLYLRTGRQAEAIAIYQQSLRRRKDYIDTYIYLGEAFRKCGRLDEAENVCRHAARLKREPAGV